MVLLGWDLKSNREAAGVFRTPRKGKSVWSLNTHQKRRTEINWDQSFNILWPEQTEELRLSWEVIRLCVCVCVNASLAFLWHVFGSTGGSIMRSGSWDSLKEKLWSRGLGTLNWPRHHHRAIPTSNMLRNTGMCTHTPFITSQTWHLFSKTNKKHRTHLDVCMFHSLLCT